MGLSFNEQFDQHGAWRQAFAQQLRQLADWMGSCELLDAAVQERLRRLEEQVRSDKVMVAFVAEFSRGKSELINALFFAAYGRRIMPASAGRTTMCPTELAYDPATPPSLRLLPIDTRKAPQSLADWRLRPEHWTQLDLDVHDAEQLARAFEKVSEVLRVPVDEARALGFWRDGAGTDADADTASDAGAAGANPVPDAAGLVEVPRWRHALINIPHALLKQGLVILDTPGLNAVGAEPELTINLIPQAHAVLFMLGADTGVTQSDLAIWREHLAPAGQSADARLVVLNKIDTLWDTINTPAQVQAQLDRQSRGAAEILGVPLAQVLPVSAQKGLIAKMRGDADLLASSGLPQLEEALAEGIMGRRQGILRAAVASGVAQLRAEAERTIHIRRRDLDEQMLELRSLRGKNALVIDTMRSRIEQEQREFDASAARIQAVRAVHLRLLRDIFQQLGARSLKAELTALDEALQARGLKLGVRKIYAGTFSRLRMLLGNAQSTAAEIHAMLGGTFRQLNAEYGFSLQAPQPPSLGLFQQELQQIEDRHLQYLGVGNALRLAQQDFSQRLIRALGARLRAVFEAVANELELWSKSATAQLDAQLRERKRSFARRIEAVDRIRHAASGLVERIAEIEQAEQRLSDIHARLQSLTQQLLVLPGAPEAGSGHPTPSLSA